MPRRAVGNPEEMTQRRSSASRPAASDRTNGNTRCALSATPSRHLWIRGALGDMEDRDDVIPPRRGPRALAVIPPGGLSTASTRQRGAPTSGRRAASSGGRVAGASVVDLPVGGLFARPGRLGHPAGCDRGCGRQHFSRVAVARGRQRSAVGLVRWVVGPRDRSCWRPAIRRLHRQWRRSADCPA
jgi:hypothetical protein